MTDRKYHFDIAIAGGGLSGSLAALALAAGGFSCAVIDAVDPDTLRGAAFDGRTCALSYAGARVFRRLGLWDALGSAGERGGAGYEPVLDILVTDGTVPDFFRDGGVSSFFLHFGRSRKTGHGGPLGYIVENRVLRNVMLDAMKAHDSITLFMPSVLRDMHAGQGCARIRLDDGQEIGAALVIAADGRNSPLRTDCGIGLVRREYDQTGIVATIAHERPHHGMAHEFFLPSGPFAILPMTGNRSSIVWTEKRRAAPAYMALDDNDFLDVLRQRTGPFPGALSLDGPRWSYPLSLSLAESYIAERLALVGDAAHGVHPVAGQGFNLAVRDIAALADVLCAGRDACLDIGSAGVLENYQCRRRFDSMSMALGMDLLNRLFSNDIAPLRLVRDIGMSLTGKAGFIRDFLVREAGSDAGWLPDLMKAQGGAGV